MNVFQKKRIVKNIDTLAKIYTYTSKHKLQFIQLGSNERALKENQCLSYFFINFFIYKDIKNSNMCMNIYITIFIKIPHSYFKNKQHV